MKLKNVNIKLKNFLEKHFIGKTHQLNKKSYDFANEAINFEKEVIFIAIPKTGTSSVRKQLIQEGNAMINYPHLSITQIRDFGQSFKKCLKRTLSISMDKSNFLKTKQKHH